MYQEVLRETFGKKGKDRKKNRRTEKKKTDEMQKVTKIK